MGLNGIMMQYFEWDLPADIAVCDAERLDHSEADL